MSTIAPDMETNDGAARARLEKVRGLSIIRDEPVPPRSPHRSRVIAALVALLGAQALLIAYFMVDRPGDGAAGLAAVRPADAAERVPAVAGPAVAIGEPGVKLQAQGFVVALRQATVSTRVAGIVSDLPVDVGDHVEKGEVVGILASDLAEKDLRLAERELSSLRAAVARARAGQEQADSEYRRELLLARDDYSTSARVAEKKLAKIVADTALASSLAELSVGEVRVERERSLLSNYTIRAPFSGVVIAKNSQVGELVAPMSAGGSFTRTGICTIVDMDSLMLLVDVSEKQMANVEAGQPVEFRLYSNEQASFSGRVVRVLPTADRAKGTLQVRIAIQDKDARMLPGMRASVNFM